MRALWWLLVALGIVWLWRSRRPQRGPRPLPPRSGQAAQNPSSTVPMVACAVCQLHVPQGQAVSGQRGVYCCAEHQRQAEA